MAFRLGILTTSSVAFMAVFTAATAEPTSHFNGYAEAFGGAGYGTQGTRQTTFTHQNAGLSDYGVSGHANMLWTSGIGLQADLGWHNTGVGNDTYVQTGGAFHVYGRSEHLLYGVFASIGDPVGDRTVYTGNRGSNYLTSGVEGGLNLSRFSLDTQLSYTTGLQGVHPESSFNAYFGAAYFLDDNTVMRVGTGAAQSNSEDSWSPGSSERYFSNLVQWQGGIEHRFEDSPLSLFASYQGSFVVSFRNYYPGSTPYYSSAANIHEYRYAFNTNRVMIGIRYYFGTSSLLETSRTGAVLQDHNPWYGVSPDLARTYVLGR